METILEKIKKFFSREENINKKKKLITAYNNWKIIIILFLISNILIAMWSFYLFIKINKEEVSFLETSGLIWVDRIDKDKLLEVVQIFEDKKKHLKELSDERPKISDPSL